MIGGTHPTKTTIVRAAQASVAYLVDEVVALVNSHHCLADVLEWLAAHGRIEAITDIVIQDEYTSDVILRYVEERYLVYDVT